MTKLKRRRSVAKQQSNKDKHETSFLNHWRLMYPDLPVPVREYKFLPNRRFRWDFCWVALMVAVELHGGGGRGRHASVTGQATDLEKQNLAVLAGWKCLAFNVIHLKDMPAVVDWVAELVRQELA
jgi:hypothetical protein